MLNQTIRYAAPIALAAYCGLLCERAAVINIGIEGMMLMGAMVGYGVNVYAFTAMKSGGMEAATAGEISRWLALTLAVASSGLLALLHGVVSIRFKTDQIISGTVINILALGVTGYFYRQYLAQDIPPGPGTFPLFDIPLLSQIPVIGAIVFSGQKPIVYFMMLITLVIHYVLFYTPWGLRTRAVGENPRAADTLGINVYRMRYINVLLGGLLAGFGGAWFTLEAVDVFNPMMTNGLGFHRTRGDDLWQLVAVWRARGRVDFWLGQHDHDDVQFQSSRIFLRSFRKCSVRADDPCADWLCRSRHTARGGWTAVRKAITNQEYN